MAKPRVSARPDKGTFGVRVRLGDHAVVLTPEEVCDLQRQLYRAYTDSLSRPGAGATGGIDGGDPAAPAGGGG